ncbi:MAG: enoyl-CoA hydratase [Caulobacteraceae bacterium]
MAKIDLDIEPHSGGAAIARVTIDNEARLNCLSSGLMEEFAGVIAALHDHPNLRAVVLTGAGDRAFVGGADIDEMSAVRTPDQARAFIERVHGCCRAVRDLPVPVIARINGYALGAGLELAAACDFRIAAEGAILGMPEVKLGIPSVVEAALLPGLVGWGRARRMLLLGETFRATEALGWGLIDEIAPPNGLDGAVSRATQAVLETTPRALSLQKALIRRWEELPMSQAITAGIDAFADAWTTDEPVNAMAAYQAARQARKSGI